jgi:site-specific DNA-cytosine methylase
VNNELPNVGPADVRDGSFVHKFAARCVHNAIRLFGKPFRTLKEMAVASACSGSGMDFIVADAVSKALQAEGVDTKISLPFFFEMNESKRNFCVVVSELLGEQQTPHCPIGGVQPCAFGDVGYAQDETKRTCYSHPDRTHCRVFQYIDGLTGGFSCKDLSRVNPNRHKTDGKTIFESTATPGQTAQSSHGIFSAVEKWTPDWVILENVDDITDSRMRGALDSALAKFGEMHYDVKTFNLDTVDYSLPQSRKRLYIVAIRRPGRSIARTNYAETFEKIERLLKVLMTPTMGLPQTLLSPSDERLSVQLAKRCKQDEADKDWNSLSLDKHRAAWGALGKHLSAHSVRITDMNSPWYRTLTSREQD